MDSKYYLKKINEDYPRRADITPLFEDSNVFRNLIKDLVMAFKKTKIDRVVALDSLGFILGAPVAYELKKPLIIIRKEGKLPQNKKDLNRVSFENGIRLKGIKRKDLPKRALEIKKSSIKKGDKILIVDEWIEVGTQMKAAIKLVEKLGGKVVGIATIKCERSKTTDVLFEKYNCKSIIVKNEA
jgi:adenine phosphoribosyltransferase